MMGSLCGDSEVCRVAGFVGIVIFVAGITFVGLAVIGKFLFKIGDKDEASAAANPLHGAGAVRNVPFAPRAERRKYLGPNASGTTR